MRNLFFLISCILLSNFTKGQTFEYSGSNVFVNRNHDQIIINEYYLSPENYWGLPGKSTLYNLPLDCEEGMQLKPSNEYNWAKNLSIIYGQDIPNKRVFIYDKSAQLLRQIDHAELFTFLNDNIPVFIRGTKIIYLNLETGQEDLIYEFDKQKYTFHSPLSEDGPGFPIKFDYYWGGIRGQIYSTDYKTEDGFTFVIDTQKKELIFWLQGNFTQFKNVLPPEKGLIINAN